VVIYAYNHHVRLLSPEPAVVKQPQFTRVEEPTLLCNQVQQGDPTEDLMSEANKPFVLRLRSQKYPDVAIKSRNFLNRWMTGPARGRFGVPKAQNPARQEALLEAPV
jgi:hypothetical protein